MPEGTDGLSSVVAMAGGWELWWLDLMECSWARAADAASMARVSRRCSFPSMTWICIEAPWQAVCPGPIGLVIQMRREVEVTFHHGGLCAQALLD